MPTKPLPANPNLQHLRRQARDLLRAQRAGSLDGCQRIREFHPRFRAASDSAIGEASLQLSDAQLAIAREYGFPSWPRLKARVEAHDTPELHLPHHERITDEPFKLALELVDAGDATALRAYLAEHPAIVRRRVTFEGGNYFANPTLLEFVAENPTRHGSLPPTIVEVARTILEADGAADKAALDSALELVASSDVARACGVQAALLDLLCTYGADPNAGIYAALVFGEFEAVDALRRCGASMDLTVAAATGGIDEVRALLPAASGEARQKALAMAANYGHADIVAALLDAGEDPNRYAPVGGHSHATPLHQAALNGHEGVVRLLVERGARTDIEDIHHHATPAGWAQYAGHHELVRYLISKRR